MLIEDRSKLTLTPEMEKVINDGQRLLTYIARNGHVSIDESVAQVIVKAKHKMQAGLWSAEDETQFLMCYDQLAKSVHPVTVDSIHAIIPTIDPKSTKPQRKRTRAEQAVIWYRRGTMCALIGLLMVQVCYLFGHALNANLLHLDEQKQQLKMELSQAKQVANRPDVVERLADKIAMTEQQFDANYKLLANWNRLWTLGVPLSHSILPDDEDAFATRARALQRQTASSEAIEALKLEQSRFAARQLLFEHMLFAESVLKVLQGYILPLLYGLLGAFIFILRDLLREIKALTYSFDSEIRFRLRLTLGALGGMIIGWFLKPDEVNGLASLSPMALAFLMGYNVDILFAIMDKLIDNVKRSLSRNDNSPTTKP